MNKVYNGLGKVPALMDRGGYIPALDDAVMPDMRFEHVKYCCDLIKSIQPTASGISK